MTKIFLMLAIACSASLSFAQNRINGPADPARRCSVNNPPVAACVTINEAETVSGCITPEERDTLNGYGAFAQCQSVTVKGETLRLLSGWCACGCFSLDTRIAVSDKKTGAPFIATAWETARNRTEVNLVSLNESYALGAAFTFQNSPIALSTVGKEKKPLVVITTDLGQTISITENHPVLRGNFKMTRASNLKVGDTLLTEKGARTKIVSINHKRTKDPVVNFVTTAATDLGHVIFAEGLAVGDMKWQAMLTDKDKAVQARK